MLLQTLLRIYSVTCPLSFAVGRQLVLQNEQTQVSITDHYSWSRGFSAFQLQFQKVVMFSRQVISLGALTAPPSNAHMQIHKELVCQSTRHV